MLERTAFKLQWFFFGKGKVLSKYTVFWRSLDFAVDLGVL